MQVGGICYGNQIGGAAFLGSIRMDIVELCFDDYMTKKDERNTLFVIVTQYEDCEDIYVSETSLFSGIIDSDMEMTKEATEEATIESYGDLFDEDYHEKIRQQISESLFSAEISLARYVMDLFKKEKFGKIGEIYSKEADEYPTPEVSYDKVE